MERRREGGGGGGGGLVRCAPLEAFILSWYKSSVFLKTVVLVSWGFERPSPVLTMRSMA